MFLAASSLAASSLADDGGYDFAPKPTTGQLDLTAAAAESGAKVASGLSPARAQMPFAIRGPVQVKVPAHIVTPSPEREIP